jgi:hypothetical protein
MFTIQMLVTGSKLIPEKVQDRMVHLVGAVRVR